MQPGNIDWSVLRGSLIVLVVALAIAGSLVYGGHQIATEASLVQQQEQRRFQSARARYLTLDDEKRLIEEFAPRFAALEEAGVIGEERRLSWVETLRTVAKGMKMPSLRYEISAQQKYTPHHPLPGGVFEPYGTDMRLTMGLLHEGDLPTVLVALRDAAKGLFTVSGCQLARPYVEELTAVDPSEPNVNVSCRLTWIVARKPEPAA